MRRVTRAARRLREFRKRSDPRHAPRGPHAIHALPQLAGSRPIPRGHFG
jgi:hypothetical protein